MINDHNSSTIPISRGIAGINTCMAKFHPWCDFCCWKKLLLLYCIIIMNLQKNWNHPFGGWYEYVTGQKSPNLHHPTENWRETVTNFPFDPLLIPICSTQDWPPLIIGSMAKWNVLPIWDCCCAVISTAVHCFINSRNGKKDILFWELHS